MALELVKLDNGFAYYATNRRETGFIYKEIFQDQSYDVFKLPENAFVVDAGANIGLFSIWLKQKYPSSRILAFEPAPETYSTLMQNLALHELTETVEAVQYGLGSKQDNLTLTYYPSMPGSSTLFRGEKDTLREVAMEEFKSQEFDAMFDGFQEIAIPVQTLSTFLDACKDLKSIDLLKLDIEGAEVDALRGLRDDHWKMTQNIIMEIFDVEGRLQEAEGLLKSKGFVVEASLAKWSPKKIKFYMVTGKRHGIK